MESQPPHHVVLLNPHGGNVIHSSPLDFQEKWDIQGKEEHLLFNVWNSCS